MHSSYPMENHWRRRRTGRRRTGGWCRSDMRVSRFLRRRLDPRYRRLCDMLPLAIIRDEDQVGESFKLTFPSIILGVAVRHGQLDMKFLRVI